MRKYNFVAPLNIDGDTANNPFLTVVLGDVNIKFNL